MNYIFIPAIGSLPLAIIFYPANNTFEFCNLLLLSKCCCQAF